MLFRALIVSLGYLCFEPPCDVVECLQHFNGIVPSVVSILMKQASVVENTS